MTVADVTCDTKQHYMLGTLNEQMGATVALDHISTQAMKSIAQPALAPMLAAGAVDAYRSDVRRDFSDTIVGALLSTPALRRLSGIGFLGAIDYVRRGSGRAGHRRRHNRLEHSIGVAWLADIYAREAELPYDRRQLLLAAALLHDVGHGPLSHTLEPVFEAEFGVNHHVMTRRLVTGEVPFGQEIPEHLADAGVDLDEVLALIEGEHDGDVGFLFSGQINLDTLEGINRCRAFIARRPAFGSCESVVRRWAHGRASKIESDFDAFWRLKHHVYNLFIGGSRGAVLDAVSQAYMRSKLNEFSADDFFCTEGLLRRRHPVLFGYLNSVSSTDQSSKFRLPTAWLSQHVTVKKRDFYVRRDKALDDARSVNCRYRQTKAVTSKSLADLLA